jgi:hypothetical protein
MGLFSRTRTPVAAAAVESADTLPQGTEQPEPLTYTVRHRRHPGAT